jgi:hypothetical protein
MTLQVVPHIEGMTWQDFADTLIGYNASCRNSVSRAATWQEFAQQLAIVEPLTPRPEGFQHWQEWGAALKRSVLT